MKQHHEGNIWALAYGLGYLMGDGTFDRGRAAIWGRNIEERKSNPRVFQGEIQTKRFLSSETTTFYQGLCC